MITMQFNNRIFLFPQKNENKLKNEFHFASLRSAKIFGEPVAKQQANK